MDRGDPRAVLTTLWAETGLPVDALEHLELSGHDPALPSSFRVGTAAQVSIAAANLAAATLWRLRTGATAPVSVDMRHAAIEFRSERYLRVNGRPTPPLWDKIAGPYRCGDGQWVRIHTNFPHHRDTILDILGCANDRTAVARSLETWDGHAFETAAADRGAIAAMMRRPEDWRAHPQGRAVAEEPLVAVERIGEAPPQPLEAASRPLSGLRVLDLTRIIAGPVCGRALAAHGADVLTVTAAHLPSVAPLVIDTGRGKLACQIDLTTAKGRDRLCDLLATSDIFVQGYRPGALAAKGFSAERAAAIRPGIVAVSLAAYGHSGPWAGRRGFDSIVQTACGINQAEADRLGIEGPKALPCQALDHASGYLMALGALTALWRRATEGGSWQVRVSLARTARWLEDLGRLSDGFTCDDPGVGDIADLLETSPSGFGQLTAVRHAGRLVGLEPHWPRPAMPLASHRPVWPD